jgi:prepilin-type N-terminal cleavage/methylation domain-containing protein
MRHNSSAKGFTLVEIMIVVAIIGVLLAIAVSGYLKARCQSQAKGCQENQKKMADAAQQYYLDKNTTSTPGYSDLVGLTLYLQRTPCCPTTREPIVAPDYGASVSCPNGITTPVTHEIAG